MGAPATYEQSVRVSYEHGRSDGYAEGAYDMEWNRGNITERENELRAEASVAREVKQATDMFRDGWFAGYNVRRRFQARNLGHARGYREAVGLGGRT